MHRGRPGSSVRPPFTYRRRAVRRTPTGSPRRPRSSTPAVIRHLCHPWRLPATAMGRRTPGDAGVIVDARANRTAAFVVGDIGGALDEASTSLHTALRGGVPPAKGTRTSALGEPVESFFSGMSGDFRVAIFRHTSKCCWFDDALARPATICRCGNPRRRRSCVSLPFGGPDWEWPAPSHSAGCIPMLRHPLRMGHATTGLYRLEVKNSRKSPAASASLTPPTTSGRHRHELALNTRAPCSTPPPFGL